MKRLGLLLILLSAFNAFAGVNFKNGNFYINYTDIVISGGGGTEDLAVVRTYNSTATEKGWFGFGWGSDYETYVAAQPDGSVIVFENGVGSKTRFTPKESVDPEAAAKKIVDAMRKRSELDASTSAKLIERLKGDSDLRAAYAKKFNVETQVAEGTVLYSNEKGMQKLFVMKDGFKRVYSDGKEEVFNKTGKLEKIVQKNGYSVTFNYKAGLLVSIKDSQAKQLFFEWYPDGKIKSVYGDVDKGKATYKFKGDDLVETVDVGGNKYVYGYAPNHNMTSITYSDNTKMTIDYHKNTSWVAKIVSRSGEETKYDYDSNPKNPDQHYWTTVTKPGPDGKPVANRYEYEMKTRPDGSEYTYRVKTVVNNVSTETIYSECCSLPLKIVRGNHVTEFTYNTKGLLTKKHSSKGDFVELSYHDKLNKITRVYNNEGVTNFEYDDKGNLVKASNDKGKKVLLIYDRLGRITTMVDNDSESKGNRTLTFKYNAQGKPVEITMKNVGTINVAYDNFGEIQKVESKAGHKMALQVTQAFQSLLSIVKPAGVNLNL